MSMQYHEHLFLWTQQLWPIATGDHRSGSHSSVDPAGSGHPLASPGPTGPTGPATHTAKSKWWIGRKLQLRIHLGAFLLQWLYNLTDRQVEWGIKDNAAYQLFCGWGMVDRWHCPDHTKIEEFRSRLAPETQRQVSNAIVCWATQLGFADPAKMDLDSTVQEANVTYPSDAHLMVKLTLLAGKVWTYLKENLSYLTDFTPTADVKGVKAKAKAYFFKARKDREQANATLLELWQEAFSQVSSVTKYFDGLLNYDVQRLPWNIRRAWAQVQEHSSNLFLHIASFICQGVMVRDKPLSLHAQAVSCFNKGKLAQGLQFGRAFQLGRIEGNFLLAGGVAPSGWRTKPPCAR